MKVGDGSSDDGIVTPMTITQNYELYIGQLLFTDPTGARNINIETNEPVSLDEVYMRHFTFHSLSMLGAEVLTRNSSSPYMKFDDDGYAIHVETQNI